MGEIKIITRMPFIPLRGMVVFPHMTTHIEVGREKSINALEHSLKKDQLLFVTSQKNPETNIPTESDFYTVGTICKVKQMVKGQNNIARILIEGMVRAKIRLTYAEDFYCADIEELEEEQSHSKQAVAFASLLFETFETLLEITDASDWIRGENLADLQEPNVLVDRILGYLPLPLPQAQELLEMLNVSERAEETYKLILDRIEMLELMDSLEQRVKSQIEQSQKEYFLREKISAFQRELGDEGESENRADEYHKKLDQLELLPSVREKIEREIQRFKKLPAMGPETGVIENYLETFFSLPWNTSSDVEMDLERVQTILDADHFGLEQVKERIVEYMAVRQIADRLKAPILCLVGPPGVGKTSISKSIARATGREFVRISLGGVRDEAEIRGHRRTYIGAIPGRVLNGIKEAKVNNPVFLFDEIDKMSSDFRGDPASAMLEVLDPEQNKDFTDHYLELPFDLSRVLFITTANTLSSIPAPLLDRMEIIELSSYTDTEKEAIAEKHLLPKQVHEHGLKPSYIKMEDGVIMEIIQSYTRESGVRQLERNLAKLCRKATLKKVKHPSSRVFRVKLAELSDYLGPKRFFYDAVQKEAQVGTVTGLAWTSVGGITLSVDAVAMEGGGSIELTGQLGNVMKESAKAGISYIRSIAQDYGLPTEFYKNMDIHVHIPEGATPKDGPSAGITMTLAILSALTGIPVSGEYAMTGEITLRGKILPVGGIKEKVLAAYRAGLRKVIMPKENEKDLSEIPPNIRAEMDISLVTSMKQVEDLALTNKKKG